MKGIPSELLLLLLFGAFMVFNIVMQRAARKRQLEEELARPAPQEMADEDADEVMPPAPAPLPGRAPAPRAQPRRATGAVRTTKRRFSRQTLFGSQRAVQDAFVMATILGRCRADEPHESR